MPAYDRLDAKLEIFSIRGFWQEKSAWTVRSNTGTAVTFKTWSAMRETKCPLRLLVFGKNWAGQKLAQLGQLQALLSLPGGISARNNNLNVQLLDRLACQAKRFSCVATML